MNRQTNGVGWQRKTESPDCRNSRRAYTVVSVGFANSGRFYALCEALAMDAFKQNMDYCMKNMQQSRHFDLPKHGDETWLCD
jgi:hypothetical protein